MLLSIPFLYQFQLIDFSWYLGGIFLSFKSLIFSIWGYRLLIYWLLDISCFCKYSWASFWNTIIWQQFHPFRPCFWKALKQSSCYSQSSFETEHFSVLYSMLCMLWGFLFFLVGMSTLPGLRGSFPSILLGIISSGLGIQMHMLIKTHQKNWLSKISTL